MPFSFLPPFSIYVAVDFEIELALFLSVKGSLILEGFGAFGSEQKATKFELPLLSLVGKYGGVPVYRVPFPSN